MRLFGPIIGREDIDAGNKIEICSPFDQIPVGVVSFGDSAAMSRAIDLAALKQAEYAGTPSHQRIQWLRAIADGIQEKYTELTQIICDEAGKPVRLAEGEVKRAIGTFQTAAEEVGRITGEILPLDAKSEGEGREGLLKRVPIGPVAAISPFNFPLNLVAHKVAGALAAGNTIVLKPASQTPMSAVMLGRIALEAGVPPGVFNVVPCPADEAEILITDERMKMLSFTGSPGVGWALKAKAARKRVTLELGGNAAAIVEPDADLVEAARKLALGAFVYAGQVCISVQRIFVHERAATRFYNSFLDTARSAIRCGDPNDINVICGPVIDGGNADRILEWIDQATSSGGKMLLEPKRDGNVITPAVLTQVPKELPIVAREAFGPVVVIETYRGLQTAINMANDTAYGLQAAIFTNSLPKVMKAFNELEVGAIIHNDYPTYRTDPMPYGGVKESGTGREGPRYTIEEMTEPRLLVLNHE
jgi:acyl-CoA reductase-like NAD-dependent aldehyde dehydrogenase